MLMFVGVTNLGCGNTIAIFWLRTTLFDTLEKLDTNTRKGRFVSIVTTVLVQVNIWVCRTTVG